MHSELFCCLKNSNIPKNCTRRKRFHESSKLTNNCSNIEVDNLQKRFKYLDSVTQKENSLNYTEQQVMPRQRQSQRPLASHNQLYPINESISEIYKPPLTRKRSALLASASRNLLRTPRTRLSESARSSPRITPRHRVRRSSIDTFPYLVLSVNNTISESDSPITIHQTRSRKRSENSISTEVMAQATNSSTSHPSPSCTIPFASDELESWFSPRRFKTAEKDQAAKLKRLNSRRMEFGEDNINGADHSSFLEDSILNHSIIGDPKERLMELCGQLCVKSIEEYFDSSILENLSKIGEGVYGEVFQANKGSVIKIFPVDGKISVNGDKQMTFADVYPEVFVSKKLTELAFKHRRNRSSNFVQLRKSMIVSGKWPTSLTDCWNKYNSVHGSDNECPDFLPALQQWIILEFDYGGEPLAKLKFNSCREARSVIEQIALSLAAAESALHFEHRDLHWHNVLVRPTRQSKLRYRVGNVSYAVQTEGINVTIIDFTVSRLCHEGNIVYVDMSDSPEIFECEGDYQFDIYRIMRTINKNDWRIFNPITNLYWLHYLMDKLLNETSYPRRDPDSQAIESELRALYDSILTSGYKSATQLVNTSFYFDNCRIA